MALRRRFPEHPPDPALQRQGPPAHGELQRRRDRGAPVEIEVARGGLPPNGPAQDRRARIHRRKGAQAARDAREVAARGHDVVGENRVAEEVRERSIALLRCVLVALREERTFHPGPPPLAARRDLEAGLTEVEAFVIPCDQAVEGVAEGERAAPVPEIREAPVGRDPETASGRLAPPPDLDARLPLRDADPRRDRELRCDPRGHGEPCADRDPFDPIVAEPAQARSDVQAGTQGDGGGDAQRGQPILQVVEFRGREGVDRGGEERFGQLRG